MEEVRGVVAALCFHVEALPFPVLSVTLTVALCAQAPNRLPSISNRFPARSSSALISTFLMASCAWIVYGIRSGITEARWRVLDALMRSHSAHPIEIDPVKCRSLILGDVHPVVGARARVMPAGMRMYTVCDKLHPR